MINEAYVSFEVAKLLKEKGFNCPCRVVYSPKGIVKHYLKEEVYGHNLKGHKKLCPTQAMAMSWLREEHNKHCDIGYDIDLNWFFQIVDLKEIVEYDYPETKYYHTENETGFNTYEEAVEAALKYCIEKIIK